MTLTRAYPCSRLSGVVAALATMLVIGASQPLLGQTKPAPKQAATPQKSAASAKQQAEALFAMQKNWHAALLNAPVPHKGCFKAQYPQMTWQEVPCSKPPNIPMPPRHGPQPYNVGNGYDYSAQVTGHLLSVIGSFDTVTTSGEAGFNFNSQTTQVADSYTLQINSNFYNSPPACSGAASPAACQGWQQYIYSSKSAGAAYMQYWLIGYNTACPSGWNASGSDCFRNSDSSITVPLIAAGSLARVSMTGSVTAGGDDRLDLADAETHYVVTSPDNIVTLANYWTTAEFAVVGDCCDFSANFNPNSSIAVRATVHNGVTSAPNCVVAGFTGETNNLNLVSTPAIGTQAAPTILSSQTSVAGTASCAVAAGIGDIHIHTFTPTPQVNAPASSLNYDFQASGDFVLAKTDDGFEVQSRQISGAPSWPNASVNQAIATKVGNSIVVLSVAGNSPQLSINRSPVSLGDGQRQVLANEGDVIRRGNTYLVRDLNGNSTQIIVQSAAKEYLDVYVGLGRWPTQVQGLLVSAKDNVNAVVSRTGTVFPAPFNFSTFYNQYGDSWRVTGGQSFFGVGSVNSPRTMIANPTQPFDASRLPAATYQAAKNICQSAGVKQGSLDDCILDVAVIGDKKAAMSHVQPRIAPMGPRATTFVMGQALPGPANK